MLTTIWKRRSRAFKLYKVYQNRTIIKEVISKIVVGGFLAPSGNLWYHPTPCSGGSRIFPGGGGRKPPGGAPGYNFINFSWKLHEIEKNLVARGGHVLGAPPLDLPLPCIWHYNIQHLHHLWHLWNLQYLRQHASTPCARGAGGSGSMSVSAGCMVLHGCMVPEILDGAGCAWWCQRCL